ncbi:unnamed protein product [Rotaria sp. Silwood2]|nr:unnamed protein product [Rotaria sp. Silwood2]CAF2677058.1 unnamed protein product [Rotaria sp. Silwood2]CAF3084652.1 unnamed protein product [Rotaria sp. Silwood2]CAF3903494.1 unnamed protein product [Rotaria sp. Silwood2]CAF3936460.1 unnamed protein product [Rotaria sp. Silwood2]
MNKVRPLNANQIPNELLNDKELNLLIKQLPENYNFEIHKTIWRIKTIKAKRVAMQMPEGLFIFACTIADILRAYTNVDIVIMGDVAYGACCIDDHGARALNCDLLIHYGHSCLVPIDETPGISILYIFVDIQVNVQHIVDTLKHHFTSDSKLALVSTIQFVRTLQIIKEQLKDHIADVIMPQTKPLSPGEILGCTSPIIPESYSILYIGDGRFHIESIMIHNPDAPAYKYDPYSKEFTREYYDTQSMHTIRQNEINKAANGQVWGLVLGSLGRQGSPKVLQTIKQRLKANGKKFIQVVMPELMPDKLKLFKNVDVWIQTSCPRLSIDWGAGFQTPILTPYEAMVALRQIEWQSRYPMDFYSQNSLGPWTPNNLEHRPIKQTRRKIDVASKIQTFTPTLFTMSNQQPTAEKSVQTQDSPGSATVYITNNPENTATEVANTLVSMATGRQRGTTTVKPLNVISVSNQSPSSSSSSLLPVLSLADFTTSHGVPTATALAHQVKLRPRKQENILESTNDDDDDNISMSTDEYNQISNDSNSTTKNRREQTNKPLSTSKNKKNQPTEPIQYGPILVKPRKHIAPTLANGRKSKDEVLPPEEDLKRKQRRDRNKQAAAKCRKKRNELRERLEKTEQILVEQEQNLQRSVQNLTERKHQLEILLHRHACLKNSHISMTQTTSNNLNLSKTDVKIIPTTDSNNSKRVTINLTNAQDLFTNTSLTRLTTTTDPSSSGTVPMITIHILPEVAQALLGSTSIDKNKLADLLQQANTHNTFLTTTNNYVTSDSISTNTSMNTS